MGRYLTTMGSRRRQRKAPRTLYRVDRDSLRETGEESLVEKNRSGASIGEGSDLLRV